MDRQALAHFPDDLSLRFGPDRALTTGEIELLCFTGNSSRKTILREDDVQLMDRHFVLGDMARRLDTDDIARCIVLNMNTEVMLEGVFSAQAVPGWVPVIEVINTIQLSRGDHVAAQDWIGVVEEVLEAVYVAGTRGQSNYSFFDMSSGMFPVGSTSQEVMRDPVFSGMNSLPADLNFEVVLANSPSCVAVNWYALNQLVPMAEQDKRPRPRRFWSDLNALTLVRGAADQLHSVGDRVLFRHAADARKRDAYDPQRPHAQNAFIITRSRTTIECLWHDGSLSSLSSCDLEPCTPFDEEHDVSPGDLAFHQGEGDKRLVVTQSVNAEQRTVSVRFLDTSDIETVSALELDPIASSGTSSVGVRRGDTVMLMAAPSSDFPLVSRIGESELDYPAEEALRNQLSAFGISRMNNDSSEPPSLAPIRRGAHAADIVWYGEVVDLLLDGQALVRLPSGDTSVWSQDRLVVFDDGFDPTLGWGEGMFDTEGMDGSSDHGSWQTDDDGADEWAADDTAEIMVDESAVSKLEEPPMRSQSVSPMVEDTAISSLSEDDGPWQRFSLLESAPSDHHYIDEKVEPPSKTFSTRLQKEYKALRSSLPDNILVQAYEDRIDLIRAMLIGPAQTPYEDAPFVFDFFLPPSRYPSEAPLVHFHSWTGSQGRVNPNLYTEGKVCLSLLGTWSGEKTESWDPHRSSVFQILISLQGLVLVREPYFLEPGFEKQMDTADGVAASALYSERTFVLSRSQIRRAVEQPPRGLEAALRHYYFAPGLDRLKVVVEQIQVCLYGTEGRAEEGAELRSPWLSRMTQGTAIPLRRVLAALEKALLADPP